MRAQAEAFTPFIFNKRREEEGFRNFRISVRFKLSLNGLSEREYASNRTGVRPRLRGKGKRRQGRKVAGRGQGGSCTREIPPTERILEEFCLDYHDAGGYRHLVCSLARRLLCRIPWWILCDIFLKALDGWSGCSSE